MNCYVYCITIIFTKYIHIERKKEIKAKGRTKIRTETKKLIKNKIR